MFRFMKDQTRNAVHLQMKKKQNEREPLPEIIILILKERERERARKRADYHNKEYRLNNYFFDYHFILRLNTRRHILYKEIYTKSIILRPTRSDIL